jgi:predicted lipoprotein with Yx(FWY)xxD motif
MILEPESPRRSAPVRSSLLRALGSVALLVLAACGGAGSTPAPTATAAGAPTETAPAAGPTETASAGETAPSSAATSPGASSQAGSSGHTIDTASGPNGLILTGAKGMTVYIYAKDKKKNVSTCTAACATNWPAVTVPAGKTPSAGSAVTGKLATFKRSDGKTQVSYNGAPLYYFAGDSKPGDMNGDGVSGVWSVATPASTLGGKAPAPAPTAGY